ncbi:hypothetical protein TNCV_3311831 [Trichonephila clavipes]|nr:hypothetical protein TNCV_3311831 [Trichonephila clavipes]
MWSSFGSRIRGSLLLTLSGRGSLMVKETKSWLMCHEFKPTATEDPPCRGAMHVKSVEARTSSHWCGVEIRKSCQLRCRPRHLIMVQN